MYICVIHMLHISHHTYTQNPTTVLAATRIANHDCCLFPTAKPLATYQVALTIATWSALFGRKRKIGSNAPNVHTLVLCQQQSHHGRPSTES